MAKKSFFERLTGATQEETFKDEFEDEISSLKKTELEQPKKNPFRTRAKKTIKEKEIPFAAYSTEATPAITIKDEETMEDKGELLSEKEGKLIIDVYQTDAHIFIKSTIAGVKPDDLDVSITNNMVTIKGVRRQDESIPQENYYHQELYWGPFSRSVILPVDIDAEKIKASLKDGILTIRLPKIEKLKTKIIKVREME